MLTARWGLEGDIIIQPADIGDAREILALQRLAYRSEAEIYDDYSIPPLTQSLEEMENDIACQLCLKAVMDGTIVGSVRGVRNGETCEIGRLIVHPDQQGRGLGTKLMEAIETAFVGVARFELFTGHRSERNIYLYRKLGYAVFKTVRVSDKLELVFMEKPA